MSPNALPACDDASLEKPRAARAEEEGARGYRAQTPAELELH
jgi:hypothetical protein